MKIDAEGHDEQVIEGGGEVIRCHHPVNEFEGFTLNDVAQITDTLQRLDNTAGYKIFRAVNQYPFSLRLIAGGKFPAPWGVTVFLGDERIHTQEPQRDGADVPLGVSCEVSKSGV